MKNKNTLVLGGVFLLLVVVYFATSFRPKEVTRGAVLLFKDGVPDIDKFEVIVPKGESVTVEKQGEVWNITKPLMFKASVAAVQEVMKVLGETMIDGVVSSRVEEQARFGVTDSSAIHLKAYAGGKVVLDALIGKYTPNISHTYVRMNGSNDIVLWRGISSRLAVRGVDGWRDKTIYNFNEDDITSLTVTDGKNTRAFTLSDSTWTYTENGSARPVDQARTWESVKAVATLAGDDFAGEEDIPRVGAAPADMRVSFTVRNGDTHAFELWIPKSESDRGRFLVRSDKGDQLFCLAESHGPILLFDYRNLASRK